MLLFYSDRSSGNCTIYTACTLLDQADGERMLNKQINVILLDSGCEQQEFQFIILAKTYCNLGSVINSI